MALSRNQIAEIKGLDNLGNLTTLLLANNRISAINGLEHLSMLRVLVLGQNPVMQWTIKQFGLDMASAQWVKKQFNMPNVRPMEVGAVNARQAVAYCQEQQASVLQKLGQEPDVLEKLEKMMKKPELKVLECPNCGAMLEGVPDEDHPVKCKNCGYLVVRW
ncbi:MAG TPA: hypothetical protein VKM55_30500 [Candidatus Lokiarchaeia archaeon]|nr:hypothetical protein [Candidatus Lokiarchaeia archaeon]